MIKKGIGSGVARQRAARGQIHKIPEDLRKALTSSAVVHTAWEDIAPSLMLFNLSDMT